MAKFLYTRFGFHPLQCITEEETVTPAEAVARRCHVKEPLNEGKQMGRNIIHLNFTESFDLKIRFKYGDQSVIIRGFFGGYLRPVNPD